MNSQKAATVTMQDKDDHKIYIRKCSKPETNAREILTTWDIDTNPGYENPCLMGRQACYPKNKPEKPNPAKTMRIAR